MPNSSRSSGSSFVAPRVSRERESAVSLPRAILAVLATSPNLSIEEESNVEIDGSKCTFIDHDALEILKEFQNYTVKEKRIHLTVINVEPLKNIE